MTFNIELPAELAERLRKEAEDRNVPEADLIQRMLDQYLPKWIDPSLPFNPGDMNSRPPLTIEKRLLAIDAAEREFAKLNIPTIPDEALRREHMYEDRTKNGHQPASSLVSREERMREFEAFVEDCDTLPVGPPLSDELLRREHLYEDR